MCFRHPRIASAASSITRAILKRSGYSSEMPIFCPSLSLVVFRDSQEIANLRTIRWVLWPVKADDLGIAIAAALCRIAVPRGQSPFGIRRPVFFPFRQRRSRGCDFQCPFKVETRRELFVPEIFLGVFIRHLVFHPWDDRRQTHKDKGQFRTRTDLKRAFAAV